MRNLEHMMVIISSVRSGGGLSGESEAKLEIGFIRFVFCTVTHFWL